MKKEIADKILVIDNDSRNIFAMKAVLKSRGLECVTALSAQEGLQKLSEQNDIAVVLLDMMMPEMDGYEAIGYIRNSRHKNIPVISVTAQAMSGDMEKCITAGANDYISKPIDIDRLMVLLKTYMARA